MSELAFMFQILRTDWPGWERSERAASRISHKCASGCGLAYPSSRVWAHRSKILSKGSARAGCC